MHERARRLLAATPGYGRPTGVDMRHDTHLYQRTCSIDGCDRPGCARSWCSMHYQRWYHHGDPNSAKKDRAPAALAALREVYAEMSKRDEIRQLATEYHAVHLRLRRQRGKADQHTCKCGKPAKQWAYDHNDPNELTQEKDGVVVTYSADLDRYQPLCLSCHAKRDALWRRWRRMERLESELEDRLANLERGAWL